jgi:hypothetical protein
VRLLFKPSCACPLTTTSLPKPSLHVTKPFDTDKADEGLFFSVDMLCPTCGTPWESYAGINAPPKKPRLIV